MDKIICTCCMGVGVHEHRDVYHDRWTQEECQSCEGKGYITQERSDELWKLSGVKPKEANNGTNLRS